MKLLISTPPLKRGALKIKNLPTLLFNYFQLVHTFFFQLFSSPCTPFFHRCVLTKNYLPNFIMGGDETFNIYPPLKRGALKIKNLPTLLFNYFLVRAPPFSTDVCLLKTISLFMSQGASLRCLGGWVKKNKN
jgi:hypothetical protein